MTSTLEEKRIIWAVDPFEGIFQSRPKLVSTLSQISRQHNAVVEPVYVLSVPSEDDSVTTSESLARYKTAAEKAAEEILKDTADLDLLPPRVLCGEGFSLAETAQLLVNYSVSTKASLIVVNTHARNGIPRLLLGSFAESVLVHSPIPVVTLGPECSSSGLQNKILFATDFGPAATETFHRILVFAKSMHACVTLFHIIPQKIEPLIQTGAYLLGGGWVTAPEYLSEEEHLKRKLADFWVDEARHLGISVDVRFESTRGDLGELILKESKTSNIGWIAMMAESGHVKSTLVGSTTREVVRHAHCPVWVLRSTETEANLQ